MDNLTEIERLSLFNQYRLLADVAELRHDSEYHDIYNVTAEIFRQGLTLEYNKQGNALDNFISDDRKISLQGQEEVTNLLSMYTYLIDYYDEAKAKFPDLDEIGFTGYDDNDGPEARKNEYISFIFDVKKLYPRVKEAFSTTGDGLNSHGNDYHRISMLKKYLELHSNDDFYKNHADYVKEIIEAK